MQLLLWRICPNPLKEGAGLPFPALQIGAQKGRPLLGGKLLGAELLTAATDHKPPLAAGSQVAHPLRLTAGGDQVAITLKVEQIDRGAAPLSALSPLDF